MERALVLPPGDSAPEPQKGAEEGAGEASTCFNTQGGQHESGGAEGGTVTKAASTKAAAPKWRRRRMPLPRQPHLGSAQKACSHYEGSRDKDSAPAGQRCTTRMTW